MSYGKINIQFLPNDLQAIARLHDYDNDGYISKGVKEPHNRNGLNEDEMYWFKDSYTRRGYDISYVEDAINTAVSAQDQLEKFLSSKDKSQYSEVEEYGIGIDIRDESMIKDFPDIAKVMQECDKDSSGYIEFGKELANFLKKLVDMGKSYFSFWNGNNRGLSNIDVLSTSDTSGAYYAKTYTLKYLVDNNTGERVLYKRYDRSEEWDNNGDGKADKTIKSL